MALSRRSPRHILKDEVIDDRILRLLDRADEVMDFPAGSQVSRSTPDFTDLLREQLREHFEDEIIPAIPNAKDSGYIEETELRHELAKKALVGLKLSRLREAGEAVGARLAGANTSEELAARIAKALDWDSEAVAKFVLAHEEEPTDNSGHVSRLYSFANELPGIDEVGATIERVIGRYIRVGVARWYAFEKVDRTEEGIRLYGKFMSYSADVDPVVERASLRAVPKIQDVNSTIVPAEALVEIGKSAANAAKAAVFAASTLLNNPVLNFVPNASTGSDASAGEIHGSAEFLLSVLHDRLPSLGATSINPTIARFRLDSQKGADDEDSPTLKAVHFEGNHIFDSVAACKFLVGEGRPLANISFRMRFPVTSAEGLVRFGLFPVKIALASDHIQVTTGLGDDPAASGLAHQVVKSAVWAQVKEANPSGSKLEQLVDRMKARATEVEGSGQATILKPDSL